MLIGRESGGKGLQNWLGGLMKGIRWDEEMPVCLTLLVTLVCFILDTQLILALPILTFSITDV